MDQMLKVDNGLWLSDAYARVEDGRVINNFTNKIIGLLVDSKPATTHLFGREAKPSKWQKFKRWWKMQQQINDNQEFVRKELPTPDELRENTEKLGVKRK